MSGPARSGATPLLSWAAMSDWFERTIRRSPQPLPPDANRDSLLAAVLAQPHDDAPRRVYADWLLDQGDVRGEFILIQCALAQLDAADPRAAELREREAALLKKHKKTWVGRFKGARIEYGVEGGQQWVKGNPTHWTFARGFVDTVKMSMDDFSSNAETLLTCEPVRVVNLTGGDLPRFLEHCPQLERVTTLGLGRVKLRAPDLDALFSSKRFEALHFLNLTLCGIGMGVWVTGMKSATAASLPALTRLALWGNGIGDKGTVALASSPFAQKLRILSLSKNKVGAAGGEALVRSPYLDDIEELSLAPHRIPDPVQAALRERFGTRVELG